MPVKLGAKADHDFRQPLGLLSDCHRRIEHFLGVLLWASEGASSAAPTPQQREAIEVALRYFALAAPRHTDDEERSLFPRMRQSDDERVRTALAKLDALEDDHRSADAKHQEVDKLARRWLQHGTLPPAESHRLIELLQALRTLYQRHIAIEDNEVFPLAKEALSAAAVAEVGREMAHRRGLVVDEAGSVIPRGL